MASPTRSAWEQNFLLRLISSALQILATETTAHLTERSCQSERRRDIYRRRYPSPFSSAHRSVSLLLSLESRRRGAADRRREGETDYEVGRGREERRKKGEVVRDRTRVWPPASTQCHANVMSTGYHMPEPPSAELFSVFTPFFVSPPHK